MDKARARQLYELADRLSQVDVATLSEQQLSEREQMIARLQQELKQDVAEGAASQFDTSMHDQIKNATPQQLVKMAQEFAGDWMHYESELKLIQQAQRELQNNVTEAEVDESNAFTNARMNAIKAGKKEFTVNGKEYKVTGDTSDEKVVEDEITTEAYERLYRVFDFSNFKVE